MDAGDDRIEEFLCVNRALSRGQGRRFRAFSTDVWTSALGRL